ncbi:GntR family transcriptional regulator [Leifsonia sp. A12D58]|uniref:GntR family transcriptional regulator n=1 Tax=Leifsonia sp. A12D58 TaxID=3397674 RepID=UPI0039DFDB3F
MTGPVAVESAAERAYAEVKGRILDRTIEGGTLLSEGEIALELGVSRTPVREAFLRLQAEGWMKLYPKRGALVREVRPREINEVLEARRLIESAAVANIANDADAIKRLSDRLDALIAEQEEAIRQDDLDAFAVADVAFHQAVVEAGGNSILSEVYQTLQDRQRRMATRSVWLQSGRRQRIVDQHTELAALISGHNLRSFAHELDVHMRDIHQDLLA